jgi:polygalacturonase
MATVFSFLVLATVATDPATTSSSSNRSSCTITDFGAVSGNKTADAKRNQLAVQAALAQCDKVVIPAGSAFKIAPIVIPSHTVLHLEEGSSLVGSDDWHHYGITRFLPPMGMAQQLRPLVSAENATNVTIEGGNGTIDGNGWYAWPTANWSNLECGSHNHCAGDTFFGSPAQHYRPNHVVTFIRTTDVVLNNVTITNPPFWGLQHFWCNRSTMRHVTITAPRWTREIVRDNITVSHILHAFSLSG